VSVKLDTDTFKVSWEDIERSISEKTKAIIINNPHNPTGTTWDQDDIRTLSQLADKYDLIVISDEVYHHLIYDNQSHLSVLSDEALRKRSIVLFSFGKTFHVTGWKVGYVIAPALYTDEIRKMHQFATFCVHTPTQLAIADSLTMDRIRKVNDSFEGKRDRLIKGLSETKFRMKPASGTYFQTVNYRQYTQKDDRQWVDELILNPGIAMIPLSPFYQDETQTYQLRICFAKSNETLDSAINILQAL
jgi:methionine aminotransferase